MPGMKATPAERAAYYRDRAEELRAAAGVNQTLLAMAETYDQLAAHIEGLLAGRTAEKAG